MCARTDEISSQCPDKNEVMCLDYLRAQQALIVAEAVSGYVKSTDFTTSTIAGMLSNDDIYTLVVNMTFFYFYLYDMDCRVWFFF